MISHDLGQRRRKVELEPAGGLGTTFALYLPAAATEVERPVSPGEPVGESSGGRGETVLLVEDEEILLDALGTILKVDGYSVLPARDAQEAFRLFEAQSESIDVVFADLGLPGASGWRLVRDLLGRKSGLKGIVATGFLDPDLEGEMLANGVSATLQKPYAAEEILRKVREVLDSGRPEPV